MSVRLNPNPIPLGPTTRTRDPSRDSFCSSIRASSKTLRFCSSSSSSSSSSSLVCSRKFEGLGGAKWAIPVQNARRSEREGSFRELDDVESPASVETLPISGEIEFDRVIADAQQLKEPVVFVWMASWCRKCIYLKPKLEKLAADYYPRLRFYSVDVNTVPYRLVARAGVTKMPTIQLWKDGKKEAEVIGGNKAYIVINEVREMIENEAAL